MKNYLVLDFGGTSVKCAVMNECAEFVEQFSLPSNADSYPEWLHMFSSHFKRCQKQYEVQGIAISTCGAVDIESGVIHGSSALPYIHGIDIKTLYKNKFGITTELENDACCAALAESWLGKGKNSNHFCSVVVGSGVGGAIVTRQKIQKGHHLHGGEFGFTIQGYVNGKPKILGHVASTQALVDAAADQLGVDKSQLNGLDVFNLYDQQHDEIQRIVHNWYSELAIGLFNIQYHIDPELIVIGGAISQRSDLVSQINSKLDGIMAALPHATVYPKLEASKFGNNANLIGALKHFLNRRG
ncbi:ROK family protein [Vibrio sp. F74]|uniref:ROK family protein n=1 Tax=Vibrio sp. F74 TaxID=700020 RepID=UPI0035F5F562